MVDLNLEDLDKLEPYLTERYQDQCGWYSRKSSTNKKRYYVFQTLIIGLPSVTALVLGIGIYCPEITWLRLVALAITSAVTVIAGLLKVFQFQEQWIEYRNTAENLKKEKYLYVARLDEYAAAVSAEQLFIERVESLISRQNTAWVRRSHKSCSDGAET